MSRLARKPLEIPENVEVQVTDGTVLVKGPKGELKVVLAPAVTVKREENELLVSVSSDEEHAVWGTMWSLLRNALIGVSKGFERKLEINGVGYRAQVQGKKIVLNLGFSHPVEIEALEGVEFKVEDNIIVVSGIDKEKVGRLAAKIRAQKKPEPYKGKGIKYIEEHVRRKAGKKAAAAE
ncbi:50S ribosomal protein L6 [Patescibacteria group bacterium]|nr:50S ribosomal protein L6 [Patescibacteria group bacterium]